MTPGEKALAVFLKNATWRRYYEEAPSDACRKAIEGEFVRSLNAEYPPEYNRQILEAPLTLADWEWLDKWCGNNPRKKYIAQQKSRFK